MAIMTSGNAPATMRSTTDESSFPAVTGHKTPMHPGHDTRSHFSPRTAMKYQAYQREQAPSYPGGMGGMSDLGNGSQDD